MVKRVPMNTAQPIRNPAALNATQPLFRARQIRLPRRTILRGAGVALALPFLEAMRPSHASAQAVDRKKFFGFFIPNGTDPPQWNPPVGPLNESTLSPAMQDMKGFAEELIWPAGNAYYNDITSVIHVNHDLVCSYIHSPAMGLSANTDNGTWLPSGPTFDQDLADQIAGDAPYRNLLFSNTNDTAAEQGFISFRGKDQPEDAMRSPQQIFDTLFSGFQAPTEDLEAIRARKQSVLDWIKDDAARLSLRLGAADKARIDQHLTAVSELEKQIAVTGGTCTPPTSAPAGGGQHEDAKAMIDLGIMALSCDLTNVLVMQYSNSWGLDFPEYGLSDGVADWSDHFLSHKLGDRDRATDLDGLPESEAIVIANARVLACAKWKVRRIGYIMDQLKAVTTPSGDMLDETMFLFTSENGDGDSHSRYDMPFLVATRLGGFQTGRVVDGQGVATGAFYASLFGYFGIPTATYGNPAAGPLAGL
jgi:hypothetical protein